MVRGALLRTGALVEVGVLTVPDFSGKLFFNTLGNFLSNPKAGLVFVDFDAGDLLPLTGCAEVENAHARAQGEVPVTFVTPGKEARWTRDEGSLLERAEARGLAPHMAAALASAVRAGRGSSKARSLIGSRRPSMSPKTER
jgi:hypothetical protein